MLQKPYTSILSKESSFFLYLLSIELELRTLASNAVLNE